MSSGGVIIFVRQGLSFSELSTSSLSSLDPYSDYVEVSISVNDSSSLSFFNAYAPSIRSSWKDSRTNFLSPSILPSSTNLFILGDFNCHHPLDDSKCTSDTCGKKAFNWIISSDLLHLNDSDISTLLHRSSGSRFSPDISFAFFSIVLSCSWKVLQNLGSDHLPILLTVSLSPVFHPNESLPFLNFLKARWDDFAFYFDSHCLSAEEYSSLFLSFAAILFTSLILNVLLTIWSSGQTALFLSLLAKTALAYLPVAFSVALTPVCLSFFPKACAILHALCWSRQHQHVCHLSSPPI